MIVSHVVRAASDDITRSNYSTEYHRRYCRLPSSTMIYYYSTDMNVLESDSQNERVIEAGDGARTDNQNMSDTNPKLG